MNNNENIELTPKLKEFVKRIIAFNSIFNSEVRYLVLVSFISSDNLVDVESCEKSLEIMTFIKKNFELFDFDDENIGKEVLEYVNRGIGIAEADLKMFKEREKK